jgi:hypothetical protein
MLGLKRRLRLAVIGQTANRNRQPLAVIKNLQTSSANRQPVTGHGHGKHIRFLHIVSAHQISSTQQILDMLSTIYQKLTSFNNGYISVL